LIKQEVDEEYASAILDVVDLRNVGVIDFATFVVGNLAARQDDMDPERIAYETFQLLGGTEQAGITVQQVAQAVNSGTMNALETYMDAKYLTLIQPIRTASQRGRVSFQDFTQIMQYHAAQGTPFAPEDPEEDMDDVEDLDTWPLDGVVMSYLRDAAATVKTFDLCALCRVDKKRRHSKDLTGLGDI
jgi:Ca2+-binding EF-hand superfamily protein